eukprot:403342809
MEKAQQQYKTSGGSLQHSQTKNIEADIQITDDKESSSLLSQSDHNQSYHAISDSSYFSVRHFTDQDRLMRTSTHYYSLLNLFKGYIGISFLAIPKGFAQVGLYGAIVELIAILILNLYSVQLLVKARNKFKHRHIKNICDLTEAIYGGSLSAKRATDILVIFSLAILPIIWQKQLRHIAYFSLISNIATVASILMIVGVEINILNNRTQQEITNMESLKLMDVWQMPIYFGVTMCIFEGNGMILNFYSEVDKPQKFMTQVTIILSVITTAGIVVGSLSYLAFGSSVQSIILYNLPNSLVGISIKLLYMMTIMGIYVLVIMPVFQVIEHYDSYKSFNHVGTKAKFYLCRSFIIMCILLISMMIPNITIMLSIKQPLTSSQPNHIELIKVIKQTQKEVGHEYLKDNVNVSNSSYFSSKHVNEEYMKIRTSSFWHTIFNLFKGYVGISFLAIPYGLKIVGIYGSILSLILVLLINLYSVLLLVKARNKFKNMQITNICELGEILYGQTAKYLCDIILLSLILSICMAYTIYFGDQIDQILCELLQVTKCGKHILYRLLFSVAIVPFTFLNSFRNLSYVSLVCNTIALVAVFFIVGVELQLLYDEEVPPKQDLKNIKWSAIPIYFGVTMCIFEGNGMILNLYSQADKPKKFMFQIWLVMLTITISGLSYGLLSYKVFGNDIESLVVFNLPENAIGITIKLMYMLTIIGSYLLFILPGCQLVENYQWYKEINRINSTFKFMLFRVLQVCVTLVVSILIPNITIMLSLIGNLCGTIISVILPVLFYNKAFEKSEKKKNIKKFNIVYLLFGTTFGVIGLIDTLKQIFFSD